MNAGMGSYAFLVRWMERNRSSVPVVNHFLPERRCGSMRKRLIVLLWLGLYVLCLWLAEIGRAHV